jgi:ABC-type antimicrobial peptide transport system permease subunit
MAPGPLSQTLRRKAHELSSDVPAKFTTMEASLSENIAPPRFRAVLLSIFAGLAVCLAIAGVYGVMAYAVGQRSNEIGLRMALGANQSDVLKLVLRQGMLLTVVGVTLGVISSLAVTRVLSSLLYGVRPTDVTTFAAVSLTLTFVALAASYVPARRATKVDPMVALRYE